MHRRLVLIQYRGGEFRETQTKIEIDHVVERYPHVPVKSAYNPSSPALKPALISREYVVGSGSLPIVLWTDAIMFETKCDMSQTQPAQAEGRLSSRFLPAEYYVFVHTYGRWHGQKRAARYAHT